MRQDSLVTKYSSGSKWLHWMVAIIVLSMLCGSFFLDSLPESMKGNAYMLHKSFGLTVLFLMLMRIFWISRVGRPPLPDSVATWEKWLSRLVQYCLYVLLLVMPLCGWIMSVSANRTPVYFGLFSMPLAGIPVDEALSKFMNQAHVTIAWILVGLVSLHIVGALKHYFFDKDNVLQRMLR